MTATHIPPDSHWTEEFPAREIQGIDELFERAGLVRNLRGKAAGITTRLRMERSAPEELRMEAPAPRKARNGVEWLAVPGWEQEGWLWHGFSTRRGGLSTAYSGVGEAAELNLGLTVEDDRTTVFGNRQLLTEAISGNVTTPLVTLRQIHSGVILVASAEDAGRELPWKGDGLMTDEPRVLLGIQTADCIPVLVADRKRHAVAAFHAGWRGTVQRIVESGIGRMRLEYGSEPEDLTAAIGPGIGACCYAVGEEVFSHFESQFPYAQQLFQEVYDSDPVHMKYPMLFLTQCAPGHSPIGPSLHLNLVEANRRQLLAAGLNADSIKVVGVCTSCQPEIFFSYRASRGRTGRMMSVIGLAHSI